MLEFEFFLLLGPPEKVSKEHSKKFGGLKKTCLSRNLAAKTEGY